MLDKIVYYVLMFFIYSALGWAVESTYRTLGEYFSSGRKEFKIINTGFLNGPICPIYGTGALVFDILVLPKYLISPRIISRVAQYLSMSETAHPSFDLGGTTVSGHM